jgi:methionyl-tRNA formyltransferase
MKGKKYCVIGRQPWNRKHFDEILGNADGEWDFIRTEEELAAAAPRMTGYRYVFFLHWSEKVPADFLSCSECVCFHMTDVPYGRGGSPLQNLIARGHKATKLTALRMTAEFDAGPVYRKQNLSLEGGNAEEIFIRASRLSCTMAKEIASEEPEPVAQTGEVVVFKRRKPSQSALPTDADSLENIHDHIRMLDCEGYPHAFLDIGNFRLTFRRATLRDGAVEADVMISPTPQNH